MEEGVDFECGEDIEYETCDYEGCKKLLFYHDDKYIQFITTAPPCEHHRIVNYRCCKDHENIMTCRTCHKSWAQYREEKKTLEEEVVELRAELKKYKKE